MRGKICAALVLALTVTSVHDGPTIAQSAGAPVKSDATIAPKTTTPSASTVPAKSAAATAAPKSPARAAAPVVPAKELFGKVTAPAPMKARAIGFYAKGCLAGAKPLALDGPAWQAMRLSRNRYWGHPDLIRVIEKLAKDAKENDGWHGLLVGDISQPRGGPMLTGHASHQVGLDADIWLSQMPDRTLTEREREDTSATSMLAEDKVSVDPKIWTPAHVALIRRAASYPEVERVLVHPAIKKALCVAISTETKREWLAKVRPYWGHHYHMHIRIGCPKGSDSCRSQPEPANEDGCGREVDDWLRRISRPPPPPAPPPVKPPPPPKPTTLDQLPAECRIVLASGSEKMRVRSPVKTEPKTK